MKLLAFSALLAASNAAVAPNFPIAGGPADLTVVFGNNTVAPPGELIPRAETANPPRLSVAAAPSGPCVILLVDTDVPRNNTRVQLLHWLAANVSHTGSQLTPGPDASALAPYRQPSPPAGDIAHAYTVLLFAQPANFSVPAQYKEVLSSRVPFDTRAFVQAARLGTPLASNYFRVQNGTTNGTTSATPTGSATSSRLPSGTPTRSANGTRPATFTGAAAKIGEGALYLGAGLAVVGGLL